tara:strand:- start:4994 stop:6307 length:1314 start_codon:yes stop_codon:yes gene_type:complete
VLIAILNAAGGSVDIGTENIGLQIVLILLSIGMVGIFTSAEAAMLSVNKFRTRYLEEQGNKSARVLNKVMSKHEKFFSTILLTENAFIIFASSAGTALAIKILGGSGMAVIIAPSIMTVLVVIFGEITPKTFGVIFAEKWSLFIARPISIVMFIETFLIFLFTLVPRLLKKIFNISDAQEYSVSEAELRMMIGIGEAEGSVDASEADMLENIFRFGDSHMTSIMTPRTEIIWLQQGTTYKEFLEVYKSYNHSRFPVYQESMEDVIGILSVKDIVFKSTQNVIDPGQDITIDLRPAFFVPETKTVSETFTEMQIHGHSIALTVDEFGGIAGIATLKQLVGVIVGEVNEEEQNQEDVLSLNEHTYLIDAGKTIVETNEELQIALPEGEYQTVAGLVLKKLGRIPVIDETVDIDNIRLTVKSVIGVRVDKIQIRIAPAQE